MQKKEPIKKNTNASSPTTEDDVVFEDETQSIDGKMRALREKLKACEKERAEYLDGWQRARADAINREKEATLERTRAIKRAEERLFSGIFPILDSFDMAFSNKDVWERVDKEWRIGIEHIYAQLKRVLEEYNISVIEDVGEYNPALHEALEDVATDREEEDGKIVRVVQKGYRTGDTTLRPAKVIISLYKNSKK